MALQESLSPWIPSAMSVRQNYFDNNSKMPTASFILIFLRIMTHSGTCGVWPGNRLDKYGGMGTKLYSKYRPEGDLHNFTRLFYHYFVLDILLYFYYF